MAQPESSGNVPDTRGQSDTMDLMSDTEDDEDIPPLLSLAPMLFVPFTEDLTDGSKLPRDRLERLDCILQSIDRQHAGMKENFFYMLEREKKRIARDARVEEAALGIQTAPAVSMEPDEVDRMIANMDKEPEPGKDYNLRSDQIGPFPQQPQLPGSTPRERASYQVLQLVENGTAQLTGLENHIRNLKEKYQGYQQRETARIDAAGRRPEERTMSGKGPDGDTAMAGYNP
jgi:hypothetical protein